MSEPIARSSAAIVLCSVALAALAVGKATSAPSDFWALGDCRFGTIATIPSTASGGGKGFGASLATDGSLLVAGFVTPTAPKAPRAYRRIGDEFALEGTLEPPSGWSLVDYGITLQVHGGDVWAGAPNAPGGGAVVRYAKQGESWVIAEIISAPPEIAGGFGTALTVNDDTLIVGAPSAQVAGVDAGIVQVFTHPNGAWVPSFTLTSPAPASGRGFGRSLAVDGTTLAVGEPLGGAWSGAAHVFELSATRAALAQSYSGAAPGDLFGLALALRGDTLAIGAPAADLNGIDSGGVWMATRAAGTWQASAMLPAGAVYPHENLGRSLALTGDWLFVGAPELTTSLPLPNYGTVRVLSRTAESWRYEGWAMPETGVSASGYGLALATDGETLYVDHGSASDGKVAVLAIDGPDCNGDGVPDLCSRMGSFRWSSGQMPIEYGVPISIPLAELPAAVGPVHLFTQLLGGTWGTSLLVELNGAVLSFTGNGAFNGSCGYPSGPIQVNLDWSLFDYALAIDPVNPVLTLQVFSFLNCSQTGGNWISVELRYPVAGDPLDLDGSLKLDVCDDCDSDGLGDATAIAKGIVPDCDGNGRPDSCDLAAQYQSDCNADGVPDRCQFTRAHDDGSAEVAWGSPARLLWLERFEASEGTQVIGGALVSWVNWESGLQGKHVTLLVYADPDGDGDPADAVKLGQADAVIDFTAGWWKFIPISPVAIGAVGTNFFVGFYADFGQTGFHPAALDTSRPHVFQASWLGGDPPADPRTSPTLAGFEMTTTEQLATQSNGTGAGCFMIRAVGVPGSGCFAGMPADLTGDGVVNAADLGVLLGAWGQAGACDLDGDSTVGAGDLAILLGAWTN